jgi:hypothetical protein
LFPGPSARCVGNVKNNDPSLIEPILLARIRHGEAGGPEEAMNWHRWLTAHFVMLALAACAQGDQAQAPYAPYSPENMHDRAVTVAAVAGDMNGERSDLAGPALNPEASGIAGTVAALVD